LRNLSLYAHREILDNDDGSGAIQHWNAFAPGANEVLNAMNLAAAARTTFIPDIQGSLVATLDSGSDAQFDLTRASDLASFF